jgi:hypothetical protein
LIADPAAGRGPSLAKSTVNVCQLFVQVMRAPQNIPGGHGSEVKAAVTWPRLAVVPDLLSTATGSRAIFMPAGYFPAFRSAIVPTQYATRLYVTVGQLAFAGVAATADAPPAESRKQIRSAVLRTNPLTPAPVDTRLERTPACTGNCGEDLFTVSGPASQNPWIAISSPPFPCDWTGGFCRHESGPEAAGLKLHSQSPCEPVAALTPRPSSTIPQFVRQHRSPRRQRWPDT